MESMRKEGKGESQEVRVRVNIYIQELGRFTFTETLGRPEESKKEAPLPYAFPAFTSPSYVVYNYEEMSTWIQGKTA